MPINISRDARPQARTLLVAAAITVLLWFLPFTDFLTYPFRLFVTFIHESGHALAALLTGNRVVGLSVFMNTEGLTYTTKGGMFSQLFVSSAGYLGAMAYGALLLVLIRRAVAARVVLLSTAAFILVMTGAFGLLMPILSGTWGMMTGIPFTLISGVVLAGGLFAIARFTSARTASFFMSFLAVQCVLNALLDLKSLFFLSSPFTGQTVHTDAQNMAQATGVPAMFWALAWAGVAFVILSVVLRLYAVSRERGAGQQDLPFEDPLEV